MAARWVPRGPKPGMRLLGLMIVWGGVFLIVFAIALIVFAVRKGGEALGLVRPPTAAELVPDLTSRSHGRQTRAFRDLKKLPPDREQRQVALALVRVVEHESVPHFRKQAVEVLGDWGKPEDARALAPLVRGGGKRPGFGLRRDAIIALGKLGGAEADALLVECLREDADRDLAVAALKRHAEVPERRQAIEAGVLEVLNDEQASPATRAAADALAAIQKQK